MTGYTEASTRQWVSKRSMYWEAASADVNL